MKKIYLDHVATTYVGAEVLQTMMPYLTTQFGDSASLHSFGNEAERAVSHAREQVAKAIGAEAEEIYFTSGATEANYWIINGMVRGSSSRRALVSKIEHPSIIDACRQLEKEGYKIEYIDVNSEGIIIVSDLLAKLAKPAALVSVLTASGEIGTIQYINTIANLCHERGVPFHTDATHGIGNIQIDVVGMKIDALTISSHVLYGPRGIGALYLRKGLRLDKSTFGGSSEASNKASTQNVPAIVGLGMAVAITMRDAGFNNARIKTLREYMINQILARIGHAYLNGHRTQRISSNVNISFAGAHGEGILTGLDRAGIAVSTGSACANPTGRPSHILVAIGVAHQLCQSSVRFSIGRSTTKEEIDTVVSELQHVVERLRKISVIRPK